MLKYRKRIADDLLKEKLLGKGAVLITGAKWCGKTTTALQMSESVLYMQDPRYKQQNIKLAGVEPSILLRGDTPRLIDEWQLAPKLWDAIRFEVDRRAQFSQFILTGSAVPADLSEISHSGIGRIAHLKMRPMSLYESGDSSGAVSLRDVFANDQVQAESNMNIEQLAHLICRGGWPQAIGIAQNIALQQAVDYYDGLVETDISRVDGVKKNPQLVKKLMRSYARIVGTQAKLPTILADILANEVGSISEGTLNSYINALKEIFVIEDTPAWNPNLRSKTAIRTSDTRYYTDPSIATAALGVGPMDLINELETMGLLFENMCMRDLRIYAESIGGSVYHYRDKNGLECDAVVHLRNGDYGLIEIKLGGDKQIEEAVVVLNKLADKIDTTRMKSAQFKMVLVGVGNYAYRRDDDVLIVPISCLKN